MWFVDQVEHDTRKVLRRLAHQRVRLNLPVPGRNPLWLIDRAILVGDDERCALQTCLLRGWVDVFQENLPHGRIDPEQPFSMPVLDNAETVYRLTQQGWAVIHGTHAWIVATGLIAVATFFAALVGVVLQLVLKP